MLATMNRAVVFWQGGTFLMIRGHRSKEKIEAYYRSFVEDGILDPNVHPWVASSWRRSQELGIASHGMNLSHRLWGKELEELQEKHVGAIRYLESICEGIKEIFQKYSVGLFLLDADCVVLKGYAQPFYRVPASDMEGVRIGMEEIGTSSISIALEQKSPFWLFGPEMWVRECQCGDSCSVPVFAGGKCRYLISMVSTGQGDMPQDALISLLLTMRTSMEKHLEDTLLLRAKEAILSATPFAAYHVMSGGEVAYANQMGRTRLEQFGEVAGESANLKNVIMNYKHTPINKGFRGIPSYNKEVTWITQSKTYEDIMTVVPLEHDGMQGAKSVAVVSMPIEELRTLVAHAAGYTAKYTLGSMVGEGMNFASVRDKAARVAKNRNHVLIQGEAGTGKQRMAHGIHQASPRAAGPLISLRCGDVTPERLEQELFGTVLAQENSQQGRLELASGGTLFLDEVEKMPEAIADKLAKVLLSGKTRRNGERVERAIDVRVIAACDSDLKRLVERDLFSKDLYDVVSKSVIRMPSLRSRREDIPRLAVHIVSELAEQHQMAAKEILPETIEMLKDYDWPGNIKQLQNVLEHAFFHTLDTVIRPADVNVMGDVKPDNKWKENREVFLKAWQAAGGNVTRLASLLDVSRVTLYRYLKKYGLEKK